ncbi:guanylate kinase [Micromonospora siamensis]|uniref:Guanylate kinase n=1 Tax=Micromonospora siamensis TaxID=299152 RepID=A0A1C5I4A8_9ACTN|nr:guanylate kinase [Micromonospora siamensis]SCG52969.1 guanylate kinase [Micromonospora siamensis]
MSTDGEARPAARLTVLTGPSGTGRGGVARLVRARLPSVWVPVPVTTRPAGPGETQGVDRHFVDAGDFDRMVAAGQLLEWTRIGSYRRGLPREPVRARLAAGRPVLLPLDLPGALALRATVPDVRLILLVPPGHRPDPTVTAVAEHTVRHDHTGRAVTELVGLLGSSLLAPAQPPSRG